MRGYIFGGGAWVERLLVVMYAKTKKSVPGNPLQHDASNLSLSYKQVAATRRDFWNRIEVKAKIYALTAFWGEGSLLLLFVQGLGRVTGGNGHFFFRTFRITGITQRVN